VLNYGIGGLYNFHIDADAAVSSRTGDRIITTLIYVSYIWKLYTYYCRRKI